VSGLDDYCNHRDVTRTHHVGELLDGVNDGELVRVQRLDAESRAVNGSLFIEPPLPVGRVKIVREHDVAHPRELVIQGLLALVKEPRQLVGPDGPPGDVLEHLLYRTHALTGNESTSRGRDDSTELELTRFTHFETSSSFRCQTPADESAALFARMAETQDEVSSLKLSSTKPHLVSYLYSCQKTPSELSQRKCVYYTINMQKCNTWMQLGEL